MNIFNMLTLSFFIIFTSSCSHYIDAEPISAIKSGKTFDRQGSYRISAGDQIDILVYDEPKLSGTYTVSSAGFLSIPLLPPFQVAGLTAQQLSRKVKNALRVLIKKPKVSTTLTGARNFQIYFSGEFGSRGARALTNETTLLQAMSLAGGISEFATGRIVIVRKIANLGIRRYATFYEDILSGKDQLDQMRLEAGDVLIAE